MTLAWYTADDPLFRVVDQVPLGRHLGLVTVTDEVPSEPDVRPFGCPVLLGVTVTGAENLRTAITNGLADLASRRQESTRDQTSLRTDG